MDNQTQKEFLGQRMRELREKNNKTLDDMANLIGCDKTVLSKAETGKSGHETIRRYAMDYCDKLELTGQQKELLMRGDRIVVADTSALLKNPQLVDELRQEYSKVIIPEVVIEELDSIKDRRNSHSEKAWKILRSIDGRVSKNVIRRELNKTDKHMKNDWKIIETAKEVANECHCVVDIITDDVGFAARLNGNDRIRSLHLAEYMAVKQSMQDIDSMKKLNYYFADSYDDIETVLAITIPDAEEINTYLPDGYTLIISAVRNRKVPLEQRKEKIRWLMKHGADVNQRDCKTYYFPPLTHAIQNGDFEIFQFLLQECNANPNVGSRNPYDAGKILQKNEGNMPLMVAAWDNKLHFVRALCEDERTSLNQQDANGFTALIKASYWGWKECMNIIKAAGADEKIVDRDGYTAADRYQECLRLKRKKKSNRRKSMQKGIRR